MSSSQRKCIWCGGSLPVVTAPPLSFAGWLRFELVRSVLAELDGVRSVLEIGAGEGAFAARAATRYDYTGLEPDTVAFAVARRRLDAVGRGRIFNGGVEVLDSDARFDLVCAFEVLEHQEQPIRELARWRGRITERGRLLLTVPAGERLGPADLRVGHLRRYTEHRLACELCAAGLEPVLLRRFGFPLGYLLEFARNAIAAWQGAAPTAPMGTSTSGRWLQPPDRLAWATRTITAPFRMVQRHLPGAPVGTNIVALAEAIEASRDSPRRRRQTGDVRARGRVEY